LPALEKAHLFTDHYPPFNIRGDQGFSGISSDLLNKAFTEAGVKVTHAEVPWTRAQINARKHADSCFYSAARSPERETLYQWVGPLATEHIALYSMASRNIKLENLQQAKDWKVGGQLGDHYVQLVMDQGVPVESLGGTGTSLNKLIVGRIDLWVVGDIAGPYTGSLQGVELNNAFTLDKSFDLWMACHKDFPADLITRLNQSLEQYRQDGTLQKVTERYLNPVPPPLD
jgi:polar amino acid transport system substrate-binding protein